MLAQEHQGEAILLQTTESTTLQEMLTLRLAGQDNGSWL